VNIAYEGFDAVVPTHRGMVYYTLV